MIRVTQLSKTFNAVQTLHNLDFSIEHGEIVGFLGPNGAGKTTTMRILTGYMPPTSGTATVAGYDVVKDSLNARKHVGYLPENVPLYPDMTVSEYLSFFARIMSVPSRLIKSEITLVMQKTGLLSVSRKPIRVISRGYRQRVGLAQALLGRPEVLILDEPTVGLDPVQIVEIRQLIKDLASQQTVILSTHILPEVSQICDRVLIINKGRIVTDSPTSDLLESKGITTKVVVPKEKEALLKEALKKHTEISIAATHTMSDESAVTIKSTRDMRRELLASLVKADVPVLEFSPARLELEDVFLQLVTKENK